jgi:hypothetical protein
LGKTKACFYVAMIRSGTWQGFFEAVSNYKSQEFKMASTFSIISPKLNQNFPSVEKNF